MKIRQARKILHQFDYPTRGKNRYWTRRIQMLLFASTEERVSDHRAVKAVTILSRHFGREIAKQRKFITIK